MLFIAFAIILLPLVIVGVSAGIKYMDSLRTRTHTYYIPSVNIYLKVVYKPKNGYGTLYFAADSLFSNTDNFIQVRNDNLYSPQLTLKADTCQFLKIYIDDSYNLVQKVKYADIPFILLPSQRDSTQAKIDSINAEGYALTSPAADTISWQDKDTVRYMLTLGQREERNISLTQVLVAKDFDVFVRP